MTPAVDKHVGSEFAGFTFFARSHPGELCGSNGLPLTPNSITIYGRGQYLKTISHPNLCSYLDIIRGKHERTMVVSQYHMESVATKQLQLKDLSKFAFQTVKALCHLNEHNIVHHNLSPENMLLNDDGNLQLFNYGLYYMTDGGANVSFPIGHPKYTASEVYLGGRNRRSGPKVDVWSLGMILAELALQKEFWADLKLPQIMRKVLSLLHCNGKVFERLAREHSCLEAYQDLPSDLRDFISLCLNINIHHRPTPHQLQDHTFVLAGQEENVTEIRQKAVTNKHPLLERQLKELYHLWHLAGGDVQTELKKQGLIRTKAPILTLPDITNLVNNSRTGCVGGPESDSESAAKSEPCWSCVGSCRSVFNSKVTASFILVNTLVCAFRLLERNLKFQNKKTMSSPRQNEMEVDEASGSGTKSVMASSGTVGSVSISLHPLVIMNISEHWTRLRAQKGTPQQVIGAVIGKQKGRNIEIMNSFELLFSCIGEITIILKKNNVFSDMDFLGWYTTGDQPDDGDIKIHKQICEINESPVLLKLNPQARHSDLPVTMYESVIDLVGGEATMLFVELHYTLATEEAERIGVDHVARMSSNEAGESSLVGCYCIALKYIFKNM
ncbi:Putative mitogen-activated protein kinase kinase kinase 7-like [Gryllus bimaculatus]|nr:Putative mitogen-activated protein kinase kinase kinase 7-like [Gryllus bimaculatus]